MKNSSSKYKIIPTSFDKGIEKITIAFLLVVWIIAIMNYTSMPAVIPTHFNAQGIVDGYGNKSSLWILPILMTVCYLILTALQNVPHILNYPVSITKENALREYTIAVKLLRSIKLCIIIICGTIIVNTIEITNNAPHDVTRFLIPITFVILFIPVIYYVAQMMRNR